MIEKPVVIGPQTVTWLQYLGNEDDEFAAASVESDGDGDGGE